MFLAPPLPEGASRRGRLFRFASGLGLGVAAVVLLATNLVLALAAFYSVDPRVSSQELYHRTWEAARDNFHDQSKLTNWTDWEHKFDGQIHTDEDAVRFANEMLKSLDDRYTFLLDSATVESDKQRAKGQFSGIGISFQSEPGADGHPLVGRVFPGSPAEAAGIRYGDAIVNVDGLFASGFTSEQATAAIRGETGKAVTLTVRRNGQDLKLTLVRAPINLPLVTVKRLDGNIGYIRLESFEQWDTAAEMTEAMRQLADCPALIIDVRDNPGGFIHAALEVSALFIEQGTITSEHMRLPNGEYLRQSFKLTPSASTIEVSYGPVERLNVSIPWRPANLAAGRPVVLLVNGGSASAAELFTAALQDNGSAVVLGTRTFGKGIGQTYIPVGNGARLRVTNIRGFTPNGRFIGDGGNTTAFGIDPDIVVAPAPWISFGQNGDNQLAAAVRLLLPKLPVK